MWNGDPRQNYRDARRAARYNRKAAKWAAKDMRRAARYRRRGSFSLGPFFVVFLLIYFVTHAWFWVVLAVAALFAMGLLFVYSRSQMVYQDAPPMQQPPMYQPPQNAAPPPYQSYDQGYQPPPPPESYREGGQQYQYPQSSSMPKDQNYQEPQVDYPQQELPPMQQ